MQTIKRNDRKKQVPVSDIGQAVATQVVDGVVTVTKLAVDLVTAPFYLMDKIWSKIESENNVPKHNIRLEVYLQPSVLKKLDKDKKLVICAAASSLPPNDDPENNKRILIALLASALLVTSGVAIVVYSGSSGLLPTLLIETGTTGINQCKKIIENNEKFLWKEWSNEMLSTACETLVLGALNKLRKVVPFKLKGKVNKNIINVICNIYDTIEPFSNVIICIANGNNTEEIVLEILKSFDEKYSTSFSGLTVFDVQLSKKKNKLDGFFSPYTRVDKEVKNLKIKIYYDKSLSINVG